MLYIIHTYYIFFVGTINATLKNFGSPQAFFCDEDQKSLKYIGFKSSKVIWPSLFPPEPGPLNFFLFIKIFLHLNQAMLYIKPQGHAIKHSIAVMDGKGISIQHSHAHTLSYAQACTCTYELVSRDGRQPAVALSKRLPSKARKCLWCVKNHHVHQHFFYYKKDFMLNSAFVFL